MIEAPEFAPAWAKNRAPLPKFNSAPLNAIEPESVVALIWPSAKTLMIEFSPPTVATVEAVLPCKFRVAPRVVAVVALPTSMLAANVAEPVSALISNAPFVISTLLIVISTPLVSPTTDKPSDAGLSVTLIVKVPVPLSLTAEEEPLITLAVLPAVPL